MSRINQISVNTKNMLIDFFEDLVDVELRIQKLRIEFNKEYELVDYDHVLNYEKQHHTSGIGNLRTNEKAYL